MSEIKYWMWLACLTNLRPRAKIEALSISPEWRSFSLPQRRN